jgi:hypothetical protein
MFLSVGRSKRIMVHSLRRQGHDKTAAPALHDFAARIAAVAARDLPYQRQA